MFLLGFIVLGEGQTTAPATQPMPLIDAMAQLPRNLWPTPGDLKTVQPERDRWLMQHLRPQTCTFSAAIEHVSSAQTDFKGVKFVTVRLRGTVTLWGKQRKILCDALIYNGNAAPVGEWKNGLIMTVSGGIASVFAVDNDLTVVMKNATLISIAPPK